MTSESRVLTAFLAPFKTRAVFNVHTDNKLIENSDACV